MCLLVFGGYNLLVLVKGVGSYMQLGTTLDDALGESHPMLWQHKTAPAYTACAEGCGVL
jgi:hypothetical protein